MTPEMLLFLCLLIYSHIPNCIQYLFLNPAILNKVLNCTDIMTADKLKTSCSVMQLEAFCWHCLGPLVPLESGVNANQYKVADHEDSLFDEYENDVKTNKPQPN